MGEGTFRNYTWPSSPPTEGLHEYPFTVVALAQPQSHLQLQREVDIAAAVYKDSSPDCVQRAKRENCNTS